MKKILIYHNTKMFLPEVNAYKEYFKKNKDFDPIVVRKKPELVSILNKFKKQKIIVLSFPGFFVKAFSVNKNVIHIHDYTSSSIGRLSRLKNYLKRRFNFKPHLRIFQNKDVKKKFNFRDDIPFLFRPMGINKLLYNYPPKERKKYDFIYAGTIRDGVIKILLELLKKNYIVAYAGIISPNNLNKLYKFPNFKYFGVLSQKELFEIYSKTKSGLNIVPNEIPYIEQDSTKVLEYLAAKMIVLSNNYKWIKTINSSNISIFKKDKELTRNFINNHLNKKNDPKLKNKYKVRDWSEILNDLQLSKVIKSIEP